MNLKFGTLGLVLLILCGCSQPKPKTQKQYTLTGKIVSVNAKEHTAMIDAAAVPGYMDAMKMDYPIPSDADLTPLKPGESITGTLNVADDGSYTLSNIKERSSAEPGK